MRTLRTAGNARLLDLQTMLADIWRATNVRPAESWKRQITPTLLAGLCGLDCELDWIRDYGKRCFNHGNAHGMEAGRLLFEEQKVGAGKTAVTREMITAAHGVTLESGDVVLSERLLERIYLVMSQSGTTAANAV